MTSTRSASWTAGEQRRLIKAHGWSVQLVDASFDHLAWRGDGILRGLRVVVRDEDWRTPPAIVDDLTVIEGAEQTVIRLTAHVDDLGIVARWVATLTLRESGLRLELDLEAENDFRRNRIGLVALLPPDLAGRSFSVAHPDGTTTASAFPREIAPHQPALDIRGLDWDGGRTNASLRFEGDVFEMEDQRNWTDASFKVYSTPLAQPFPVALSRGDRVHQAVELRVSSTGAEPTVEHGLVATASAVPSFFVGAATAPGRSAQRPGWLNGVGILAELDLREPGWTRVLARARRDAGSGPLDIRLAASHPDQLDSAIASLCGVPVARLSVVDAATHVTTPELWTRLRALATREPITGELVGGTRAHFTELNRNHEDLPHDLDGVTFSITPQMHDVSTDQVAESIVQQRRVALQAVRIAAGRPVHVGPVTLRARFNAVATSPFVPGPVDVDASGYGPEQVWNSTDPRQTTDEYATWLLVSVVALSVPGVASIALAEAWGPRGLGTVGGEPFPAAEVLGWLSELQGADLLPLSARGIPDGVGVLAARTTDGVVVVAGNASGRTQRVVIESLGLDVKLAPWARVRLRVTDNPGSRRNG